ncbi:MAG TPA: thiamine diphosphokinase [Patescibacteria group bacterium]|nr:thiamine diphosphokinase [Patescibacteria group bacterium]
MHVVVFTSPSVQKGAFVSEAIKTADKIIAADCGALSALSLGITPEVVIGDFDSLDQRTISKLESQNVEFIRMLATKDETDTQLAITHAIELGATKISLVGGIMGNRFEHAVANIFLTYNPQIPICLVNGPSKTWIIAGPQTATIQGQKNDLLSLTALSPEVTGMTTKGLQYPLRNESLHFGVPRGISNVFLDSAASITFENGMLLLAHTNSEEL